jgi:hypothetical protein
MRYPTARVALVLFLISAVTFHVEAKSSEWRDAQGAAFKGEPTEVIGPFAIFRTSGNGGRRMLLRGLAPADRLRLYREISARPPRAAHWSEAKGFATGDLAGRLLRVENKKLVRADLAALPEPELLIVLYGSHNDGESWQMVNNFIPTHRRLQRVYPGTIATVFFGVRHDALQHREFATDSFMPWLVADFSEESSMRSLVDFAPREGTLILLLSREGVPLLSARATDLAAMRKFTDKLADLLWLLPTDNARTWEDRLAYGEVVRPLEFATRATGPLLIGNPLRADGLRRYGVKRISAKFDVAADATVTRVALQPDSLVAENLAAPIAETLQKKSVFLPAIDHGTAVAGTYDYVLDIPPDNPALAADTAWFNSEIRQEIPLNSWLVLKPIHVPEQDFGVDYVDATGKVVLKPVETSNSKVSRASQMSAFNSDWFGADGAGSVFPVEGTSVRIGSDEPIWRRMSAKDGLVDFAAGLRTLNYCVGYAWTEFEAPAEMDAWLGIGSDDGLKIWHNGQLVNDQWIRRQSRLDDDVVPLHLKAGKNQFLIKIQNATGDWSFLCRLRIKNS